MKSDLDALMKAADLQAMVVTGPSTHNPAMYYLSNGAHLTHGDLIKRRGETATLFYNPMERDEAAKSGLPTKNLAEYEFTKLVKETGGDRVQATAVRYKKMLEDVGVTAGKVALYGKEEAGAVYGVFSALQKLMPDLEIIGEMSDSVLLKAMATKDEHEIEHMRQIGKITVGVVGQVADWLSSHKAKEGVLVDGEGQPITIGEVKGKINLWLAERGAENPEGTIFAIGRDAGVPHSVGNADEHLRLGETIVFDIFPVEAGGGYFHDFTRTWCLGYAPDEVQALYEDVHAVYEQIMSELALGKACKPYQERTCELFEGRGHPTVRQDPKIQEGFVHSLGHGLGLAVHERPWFGRNATEEDKLDPGVVVTIEPGLYYPERGMGCRLENTVYARPDGQFEVLGEYPLDLVIPIKQ